MALMAWSPAMAAFVDWSPVATMLLDGGFAVVGDRGDLHRFDRMGRSVTATEGTGTNIVYSFGALSAETLTTGDVVVSWANYYSRGPGSDWAQIVSPNGWRLSTDFQISSNSGTSLVAMPGGFGVAHGESTYRGFGFPQGTSDVYVRTVAWDGTVSVPIVLNEITAGHQFSPHVTAVGTGYLAAWATSGGAVSARFLGADLRPSGSEFVIAPSSGYLDIATLSGGAVVFVYQTDAGLEARLRLADGTLTTPALIAAPVTAGLRPLVTPLHDGGFAAAWQVTNGGQFDVYARQFNASGEPVGAAFQVPNTGNEQLGGLDTLMDGRVVVSWSSSEGARVQVLDPRDGIVIGTNAADILVGSNAFGDRIAGYDGDDLAEGMWGDDLIALGRGNDAAWAGEGQDWVEGGEGNDWIVLDGGDDLAWGGDGTDSISGAAGRDWVVADAGADCVWGGDDADVLSGGEGNDYLLGGGGHDLVYAGPGDDVVLIGRGEGEDIVFGEDGLDTLHFHGWTSVELSDLRQLGDGYTRAAFTDGSQASFVGIEWLQFADTGWGILS